MRQLNRLLKLMADDEFMGLPKVLEMQEKAVPLLKKVLDDAEQPRVIHQRALICLGEIGHSDGFKTVAEYLNDHDPVFRIAAARALVKIDPEKAAELLIDQLHDEDASACNVKIQCLSASGQIKAKSALNNLRKTCKDTFLRKAAKLAVEHLEQEYSS